MKKTTIYLKDHELELLKQKAFLAKTSVTELIRQLVKTIVTPKNSKEEKAMQALIAIRSEFIEMDEDSIMKDVVKTQRVIRNEKKAKGRR